MPTTTDPTASPWLLGPADLAAIAARDLLDALARGDDLDPADQVLAAGRREVRTGCAT